MSITTNAAMLTAATVTGIISLASGLIRTREVDDNLFVKPALQPLGEITKTINRHTNDKCPNCAEEFVKPYFQITMRRIQLVVNLGSIFFGLLAQAIILLTLESHTDAISWFVWSMLPAILAGRYVLEYKDVFSFWNRPFVRFALGLAAIGVGIVGSVNAFYLDILGWMFNPWQVVFNIGETEILSLHLLIVSIFIFIPFLAIKFYLNAKIPSLRTRIARILRDHPEGYTLTDWYNHIDSDHILWSEEEILGCIRELVYQDIMTIQLQNRDSEPLYKASRLPPPEI